jgi:Zn-dependent protease with chaperone function
MTIAAGLVVYAAALSWFGPSLLTRLTNRGINPKLGVAAWLTAVAGVTTAWLAAVVVLVLDALDAIPSGPVWTLCVEVLGYSGHVDMAQPIAATTAGALIVAALALTGLVGRRIARTLRTLHSASHQHAMAARVVGFPTRWRDVVVVEADHPAAYCVAGRPRAIVVTSAALASLHDDELAAVLAHEQAHLSGRHHHILMLLRATAAGLPRVPLAAAGPNVVSRLLEMCADDTAARRHGSHPLLCGLITLTARPPVTAAAMGAASTAVLDRASRLAVPAPRGARWCDRVQLSITIGLTVAIPLLAGVLCHH